MSTVTLSGTKLNVPGDALGATNLTGSIYSKWKIDSEMQILKTNNETLTNQDNEDDQQLPNSEVPPLGLEVLQ